LGVTGFWRIWIHWYAALTRPLCQLLKDAQWGSQSLLEWDPENTKLSRPSNSPGIELAYPRLFSTICLWKKGGSRRSTNPAPRAQSTASGIFGQGTKQCG
jgi:hypothetical protein